MELVGHPDVVRVSAIVAQMLPKVETQYHNFQVVKCLSAILDYSILVLRLDWSSSSRCLLQAEARVKRRSI